ncbi:hypothetical protein EYF80_047558 [Liparis tanakae]|uniref:Uncharacterized protein n=1 Tax=Liparis tanakae TaxID=230148 RepID=A0A4Z2FNC0_9TELE|nr:hypothetical protein EYF80_047558 [Liparis tanakae]
MEAGPPLSPMIFLEGTSRSSDAVSTWAGSGAGAGAGAGEEGAGGLGGASAGAQADASVGVGVGVELEATSCLLFDIKKQRKKHKDFLTAAFDGSFGRRDVGFRRRALCIKLVRFSVQSAARPLSCSRHSVVSHPLCSKGTMFCRSSFTLPHPSSSMSSPTTPSPPAACLFQRLVCMPNRDWTLDEQSTPDEESIAGRDSSPGKPGPDLAGRQGTLQLAFFFTALVLLLLLFQTPVEENPNLVFLDAPTSCELMGVTAHSSR